MSDPLALLKHGADAIVGTGALFMALTGVAVGLRMVLRPLLKIRLGIEDCFLFAAMILFWVETGLNLTAVSKGRQAVSAYDPLFAEFLKYIYFSGIFYFPTVCCVNISILCLYRRLFTTPDFQRISLAMIIFNVCWLIPAILVEALTCLPVQHFWNPLVHGSCVWYSTFWLVLGVAELVNDAILLVLPLREIAKLQLSTRNKFILSLIFALGGLSIITGILRVALGYEGAKISSVNLIQDAIWLNVHLGSAIVCACLPTFRPLLAKGATMFSSIRHKYGCSGRKSDGSSNKRSLASSRNDANDRYHQLERSADKVHMTVSTWSKSSGGFNGDGVEVRQTVEVV